MERNKSCSICSTLWSRAVQVYSTPGVDLERNKWYHRQKWMSSKFFEIRPNCAPAKWALEKERRWEGKCLPLPLSLFEKQWSYLFWPVVLWSRPKTVSHRRRLGRNSRTTTHRVIFGVFAAAAVFASWNDKEVDVKKEGEKEETGPLWILTNRSRLQKSLTMSFVSSHTKLELNSIFKRGGSW